MATRCSKAQARAGRARRSHPSRREGSTSVTALRLTCWLGRWLQACLSVAPHLTAGVYGICCLGEGQAAWLPNILPWVPFSAAEMQMSLTVIVTWTVPSPGASVSLSLWWGRQWHYFPCRVPLKVCEAHTWRTRTHPPWPWKTVRGHGSQSVRVGVWSLAFGFPACVLRSSYCGTRGSCSPHTLLLYFSFCLKFLLYTFSVSKS